MLKKIIAITMILLLTSGCGSPAKENETKKEDTKKYDTLTIKTEVTNEDAKDDSYLVFLLPVGVKSTKAGAATQSGFYGPFETDANGEIKVELRNNLDFSYYMTANEKEPNKLQVIVTTKEDKYLRNPLNKETFVEFIENEDENTHVEISHYSKVEKLNVKITDKYPDGVLSLAFPDATFVINLEFEEGYVAEDSYEVSIYKASSTAPDGIGMYRLGRIDREFQYWDTPFFATDKLSEWSGTIIVSNYDTNARVSYEGYPKQVTFDSNGKCLQGDIINIKLIK